MIAASALGPPVDTPMAIDGAPVASTRPAQARGARPAGIDPRRRRLAGGSSARRAPGSSRSSSPTMSSGPGRRRGRRCRLAQIVRGAEASASSVAAAARSVSALNMITGSCGIGLPDRPQRFEAVHVRHVDVERDDVRARTAPLLQRDPAVGGRPDHLDLRIAGEQLGHQPAQRRPRRRRPGLGSSGHGRSCSCARPRRSAGACRSRTSFGERLHDVFVGAGVQRLLDVRPSRFQS